MNDNEYRGRRGSYTSASRGLRERAREAWHLTEALVRDVDAHVAEEIARLRGIEAMIREETGLVPRGLDVLDVGAGQLLLPMIYFGARNRVVGIDQSVIAQGFDLSAYLRMLKTNGAHRVLKTLTRKAVGIDRRYRRSLVRQLGLARAPALSVLQMDASELDFGSGSFDLVVSLLVLQHVENPTSVLREMARVTRPGGVVYFDFTLWTGPSGSLDVRALGGRATALPPWAHLRSGLSEHVQESAFINRVRLPEWELLVAESMPGAVVRLTPTEPRYQAEARRLREAGELEDYSLQELLTANAAFVWQKQGTATASS